MTVKNTVLYHGGDCIDGFTAAFVMWLYFKELGELDQSEFTAVNYNQLTPDVKGENIYIVDFSYGQEVIDRWTNDGKKVVMLDHHESAADLYDGYCDCNTRGLFTKLICKEKSGALLTYEWILKQFNQDDELYYLRSAEYLVTRVSDRDLWEFKFDDTKALHLYLETLPKDFNAWASAVMNKSHSCTLRMKAKTFQPIIDYQEQQVIEIASKAKTIVFDGFIVPVVNCNREFKDDVGEFLCNEKDIPFAITFYVSPTQVYWSLRSSKHNGVVVKEVCERMGGGGHNNSAGFVTTLDEMAEILESRYIHQYHKYGGRFGFSLGDLMREYKIHSGSYGKIRSSSGFILSDACLLGDKDSNYITHKRLKKLVEGT